jgi:thiosulfate reductase cytochrome b subunit
MVAAAPAIARSTARHGAVVRVTHWVTVLCFVALLVTGAEIVISHPRFYWGETGNVMTPSLFELPIPASRSYVRTGYGFVLPDQNGWSRALHFEAAWLVLFTGAIYIAFGLYARHFLRNLVPEREDVRCAAVALAIRSHLRGVPPDRHSYNVLQRIAYLSVVFVLFPVMIWTGLAMSPAFVSAFPWTVTIFGGHQSARTIHFLGTVLLVAFLLIHMAMVVRAGFRERMRAMISGRITASEQQP